MYFQQKLRAFARFSLHADLDHAKDCIEKDKVVQFLSEIHSGAQEHIGCLKKLYRVDH